MLSTTATLAQDVRWRPPAATAPQSAGARPRFTTELRPVERRYWVPVTQLQWFVESRPSWNPWMPPQSVYQLRPVTRWQERVEHVRIAVTRQEPAPDEPQRLVSINPLQTARTPGATKNPVSSLRRADTPATAGAFGGIGRLQDDPPRHGWRAAGGTARR